MEDLAENIYWLEDRKKQIETQLIKLKANYANLSSLYDENIEDDRIPFPDDLLREPGLTEAVRTVLKNSKKPLTPVEVRDDLLLLGLNLSTRYSNPLADIHKTLKRLQKKDEIELVTEDNQTAYKWKSDKLGVNTRK